MEKFEEPAKNPTQESHEGVTEWTEKELIDMINNAKRSSDTKWAATLQLLLEKKRAAKAP